MKTERKILAAFVLNLLFSVFEFVGGMWTGSVAILSDAVHDIGDAASIGISYALERRSGKEPDEVYTYGYARCSVLGGLVTTLILMTGSLLVIVSAVRRLMDPVEIDYNGMILFAVIGAAVNFCAAWFTRGGDSLNQRAVNLHMLEDVLGWVVVLIGAVIMRLTDWAIVDPLLSIAVALFILIHAWYNLKEVLDLFLERAPRGINVDGIREELCVLEGVQDVHHIHIRSLDGRAHDAAMHIVTDGDGSAVKEAVRQRLRAHGIGHATLELEHSGEHCDAKTCRTERREDVHHNHSHHHHHHHA